MAAAENGLDPAELDEFVALWEEVRRVDERYEEAHRLRNERLLELRLKGWKVKTLAESVGVTHQLLYSLLNKAGNSTRPRAKRGDAEPTRGAHEHDDDRRGRSD